MFSFIFVVISAFVTVQSQILAPYPRTMPAVINQPGCQCASPAPLPVMKIPYEIPLAIPAAPRAVAKAPVACLEPAITYGPVAEVPVPNCRCRDLPLPALPVANPFLPAASPVSALAPFSPLLPPANTCSRCQYLKKIPIPPPCI